MIHKLVVSTGFATALICAGPTWAKPTPGQPFITKAIQGNLAEVQMGQLAQAKSQTEGVRSFGQQLAKDHGDANEKAMAVAQTLGVKAPTESNPKQRAEYAKMSRFSGATFDRKFASHMVMDHKKDIRAYKADAKKSDPTAAYASETLPVLQKHLQVAKSLKRDEK